MEVIDCPHPAFDHELVDRASISQDFPEIAGYSTGRWRSNYTGIRKGKNHFRSMAHDSLAWHFGGVQLQDRIVQGTRLMSKVHRNLSH